jgi:uncharacterized membrane protein SpoIIM required for sporulation
MLSWSAKAWCANSVMISNLWIDLRKDNWNRLDTLTRRVETDGVKSLARDDLREFGLLYRQSAADLSAARADGASRTLEQYLNRLVGRAHNFVYSGRKLGFRSLWDFFANGYPRLFRRLSGYVVLATAIFILGGVLGTLVSITRPDFQRTYISPPMMDKIEHHEMWTGDILSAKPETSSFIMTHNIGVCFSTFVAGVTGGLLTIFMLMNTGFQIGVLGVATAQHHMALKMWSFIAAHGSLELPSIFIAGAAGLRIGAGILFPGMLRRRDSIALGGSEAVQLIAGTVPMLIIAGTLEAFLSPTHAPIALKFAVGAILFTALCFWLNEGGRKTITSEQ